jgi:hypothetical protein
MTIITIRQPGYLPNIGFFKKIQASDVFVYLDDAQYAIRSWDNRNKIRNGNVISWLSVPVIHPHHKKLNEVEISYTKDWITNHVNLIESNYTKTPYFNNYWKDIKLILEKNWEKLIDLNLSLIEYFISVLEINTPRKKSSELEIDEISSKRLLEICKKLNATTYRSGIMGKEYLDENIFKNESIDVIYENFQHPTYNQSGTKFLFNMSIIDLLFNEGDNSKQIILQSKDL